MKYKISESCPKEIIFQSLEGGYHCYSSHGSFGEAWEHEKNTEEWMDDGEKTIEEYEEEFTKTLTYSDKEGALQAAKDGEGWPLELGYVVEIEG